MSLKIQADDPPTLTQAEEEEMSTALIAKLLAQDAMNDGGNDYYAEYGNESQYHQYNNEYDYYGEESDDYAPKRYGKQKKIKAKKKEPQQRGRKRKSVPVDISANKTTIEMPSSEPDKIITEPPVKMKKVKKPLPPGFNTGTYTDNEEVLFLEGLNLHGRNWNDLARHMGTRDPHSIRSHAQKHFIKLYRDNLPLPDKVKESGEGFTLSGKPLDPDSASAKPYLNRAAMGNKTLTTSPNGPGTGAEPHTVSTDKLAPSRQIDAYKTKDELMDRSECSEELDMGRLALMPADQNHQLQNASTDDQATSPPTPMPSMTVAPREGNGGTNHASLTLRQFTDEEHDPSLTVECQSYTENPGFDTQDVQPLEMTIQSNVLLTMDLHAHLTTTGTIGFLSGEWNTATKHIQVKEAYPCLASNTGYDVTMDPTNALEVRHIIEKTGMNVVGWYHSHPATVSDPSQSLSSPTENTDDLCRAPPNTTEPFVSAVIRPYEHTVSAINWFHVGKNGSTPQRLNYHVQQNPQLSSQEETRLLQIPNLYVPPREKMDMGEPWRSHGTRLDKLINSLATRVQKTQQDDGSMEAFLEKIKKALGDW